MQPQNHVIATQQPPGNQIVDEPVWLLSRSNSCPTGIQESNNHKLTTFNGDTTIPALTITTPILEERLVREEENNELYLPLTSAVVLKRKQEMLYVPLHFGNNLTVDALLDLGAYVTAISQNNLDTIKRKASCDIFKINDPPNFQTQVVIGHLEKPLATVTLQFEIGDYTFAEHFVVRKKLTGPITGFHSMRNNSVVIDTTLGLIHFSHLTTQVKTALFG